MSKGKNDTTMLQNKRKNHLWLQKIQKLNKNKRFPFLLKAEWIERLWEEDKLF